MVDRSETTRRVALGLIATGGGLAVADTFGFSRVAGTRATTVNTTTDPKALIGLLVSDQVKKNQQEPLVTVTNTTDEMLSVTVALSDCGHGTLEGPDGSTGCSADFNLNPSGSDSDSKTVDITSGADGMTVPFTITATSPSLSFEGTRTTDVVSGNTEGAVVIDKLQDFQASAADNRWTIKRIRVESTDTERELDRVEYEITNEANETVRLYEENASGSVYERKQSGGNPGLTIEPEDDYSLAENEEYTLTVIAYDDVGNYDMEIRSDIA